MNIFITLSALQKKKYFGLLALAFMTTSLSRIEAQNYTVNTAGNVIVVTDISGNSDVLNLSQNGANIRFNAAGRTYSLNGGPPTAFPVDVPLAGVTSITVYAEAGTDQIAVAAFSAALPSLTLNGGTGNDVVNLNGDITFSADANLDIDLQNDVPVPGNDQVNVAANANLLLSGMGAATIKVSQNVLVNSGGSIEVVDGDLTVEANQQAAAISGNFSGVFLNAGAFKSNGAGALTVKGKGGSAASNFGVFLTELGSGIQGGTGNTLVIGSGQGTTISSGVHLNNSAILTSLGGDVTIQGSGGGSGNGTFSNGVLISGGARASAGGLGNLSITGIGGNGTDLYNEGILSQGDGIISSDGGNITLTGTGGTGKGSIGVDFFGGAKVNVGGTGTLTIHGTAGPGTDAENVGVWFESSGTVLTAAGEVSITAIPGGAGIGFQVNAANTLLPSGSLTVISDDVRISSGAAINGGASAASFRPYTNGTHINLGSVADNTANTLELSDTELDRVTCGTLNIGDANSGDLTVSANITRTANTAINLSVGGAVNLNASSLNSAGGNVRIDGPGGVNPSAAGPDVSMGATGTLTFGANNNLNIQINGTTPDAGYRQLNVVGKVNITGLDLVLSGSYVVSGNETFVIVNNDGADAVVGWFNNLPNGSLIPNFLGSGLDAKISYAGGTGNDVTLTIVCPNPVLSGCTSMAVNTLPGVCGMVVNYPITFSGNPAATLTYAFTGATTGSGSGSGSGATFNPGTTNVTLTASNNCSAGSGSVSCSFIIKVVDIQAPIITCPGSVTRNTEPNQCAATVTYTTPTATDNCPSPTVILMSGLASGSSFPKGINVVTWKATDGAGLTKTCSFKVTVNDNQAPTATCPLSQSLTALAGQCYASATYSTPTATDNCSPIPTIIRISGPASGSNFPVGATVVNWRATDGAGLTSTCSFTVSVTDNQAPIISCPADLAVTALPGECSATVSYPNATATDNCNVSSVYLLIGLASGSEFPQGATVNTWRAVDASGSSVTCSFTVTVSCGTGAQAEEESLRAANTLHVSESVLDMSLAPNPASTRVVITTTGVDESGADLWVFDPLGRIVWRSFVAQAQASVGIDLSEGGFSTGVYQVSLRTAHGMVTKGLIVNKL